MPDSWQVLEHGELRQLQDNLWSVEGALPRMTLRRRMCVMRLGDGRLALHSAIALREPVMAELEALGQPAILIVPNGFHRLDAEAYKRRYPQLRVYCPAASRERVQESVAVDGDLSGLPNDPALQVHALGDNKVGEVAFVVSHADGTCSAVVTDVVFNHPHAPGLSGLLMRLLGSTGSPRITRVARAAIVRDPKQLAVALRQLAEVPGLCRVVVGHGDPIEDNAKGVLHTLAATL